MLIIVAFIEHFLVFIIEVLLQVVEVFTVKKVAIGKALYRRVARDVVGVSGVDDHFIGLDRLVLNGNLSVSRRENVTVLAVKEITYCLSDC